MKTNYILYYFKKLACYSSIVIGFLCWASCNKDFSNKLPFDQEYKPISIDESSYKVAYIILEGGVGTIVGREATDYGSMPTLAGLLQNSIVSWNGVSAENKDELTSFADLLTGVEFDKHKVVSNAVGNDLATYPTIFTRMKEHGFLQSSFLTSRATGLTTQLKDVGHYEELSSDAELVKKTVEELAKEEVSIVVASFSAVDLVGKDKGYDSPEYIQALKSFDSQLETVVNAVFSRKKYLDEKWLIVVSSSRGGKYKLKAELDDGSIFSDTERNNFALAHNRQFAFKFIDRLELVDPPWINSAINFVGSGTDEEKGVGILDASKSARFNMFADKDYTVHFKTKIHRPGQNNPAIISNRSNTGGSETGWGITFVRNGDDNGNVSKGGFAARYNGQVVTANPRDLALDTWYTTTLRIWHDGVDKRMSLYTNGQMLADRVINGDAATSLPLIIGNPNSWSTALSGKYLSYTLADLRFYNVAWSHEAITTNYCTTLSTPNTDPYYQHLQGYWPGNDGGRELRDKSGNRAHFDLKGLYSWNSFSERGAGLCPTIPDNPERYVFRSIDVPRMIYSWLNVRGIEDYGLDGQLWNPNFLTK